jgi:hypothetical protein
MTIGRSLFARLPLFAILVASLALQACANRQSASVQSGVKATEIKKLHVVRFGPDKRGINELIRNQLLSMGYQASTGPENQAPAGTDALVEYRDRWQWDITMYMIGLTINVKEPQTGRLIATGNSYHGSLTRKPPYQMVREVVTNIFNKMK